MTAYQIGMLAVAVPAAIVAVTLAVAIAINVFRSMWFDPIDPTRQEWLPADDPRRSRR